MNMSNYGFKKGLGQVKMSDIDNVRTAIMEAFGITTREAFRHRLSGKVVPSAPEFEKIKAIFEQYRITDIWDND